jgi:thiol-disulfide isomerase/thioredoxin
MKQNSSIKIVHITNNNNDPKVVNSYYENKTPIFIKLYADWCGHCKTLAPIWSELEQEAKRKFQGQNLAIVSIENETFENFKNNQMDEFYDNVLAKVTGYPTIGAIINKKFIAYTGERTSEAMLDFISNKVIGTSTGTKSGTGTGTSTSNNIKSSNSKVKQDGGKKTRKSKSRKSKSRKAKSRRKHKTRAKKGRKTI